jgi:hypothetical protein
MDRYQKHGSFLVQAVEKAESTVVFLVELCRVGTAHHRLAGIARPTRLHIMQGFFQREERRFGDSGSLFRGGYGAAVTPFSFIQKQRIEKP